MSVNFTSTDLYVASQDADKLRSILERDSDEGVIEFQEWCKQKPSEYGSVTHGLSPDRYVLHRAAHQGNVHLVKYIVQHTDRKILNLKDSGGMTALFYTDISDAPVEKVIECAQVLIDAGLDLNLRSGMVFIPAPTDGELDEKSFKGDNVIGRYVRKLDNHFEDIHSLTSKKEQQLTELIKLFVSEGVSCHLREYGDLSTSDTHSTGNQKRYIDILKKTEDSIIDWPKTRLLFFAQRDAKTNFSELPSELISQIFMHYTRN